MTPPATSPQPAAAHSASPQPLATAAPQPAAAHSAAPQPPAAGAPAPRPDTDLGTGERVGEMLYRTLRDRIISGAMRPGTKLSVPALAEEFRVSRSPVRDAVIRLVQDDLARETMNRGAVVVRIEREELVSLYEAREALEWAVARLAAEKYNGRLRRRLLALLTEHRQVAETNDLGRHFELDAAFHREIRQAAQSPVLARMLDGVQGRIMVAMRSTSLTGGVRQAVADHQAIFEALSSGDPEAAGAAAHAHIRRLKELLRAGD